MSSIMDRAGKFPAWNLGPGIFRIEGSFAPNGSSAIDSANDQGDVSFWSVAYTSTGLYTVTLSDSFQAFDCIRATLQLTTGDDKAVQIGVTSVSARTFQIRCWDASANAVADIAADAGNRINFAVKVRGSTVRA